MVTVIVSCARMQQPDGGWYDEVPPRVVGASPEENSINVSTNKIEIKFNEFIKLDNATENVVICPPQLEQPEIKTKGKSVIIELKDSLKPNTTYTIDFSDAIQDFNEGNPMSNYTYTFSTHDRIDTLEVSGYVLDAETLEPVKGSLVGLYSNLADSAFTTQPLERTGRTDASGFFRIRGVAPGQYRVFSLEDSDNNFMLSQRGERLGFSHDIITPSTTPDTRSDTIWADSLHIADIRRVPYTRFLPDDICIRSFTQKLTDRYLIKTERNDPDRLRTYFSIGSEELPVMRSLNFNDSNAYVIETSLMRDTITYWLRDTALINQDTLRIEMTYQKTDSLGVLVAQTDTIEFLSKIPYEKRQKAKAEELAKWEKKAAKDQKKGKTPAPRPDEVFLQPKMIIPAKMSPVNNVMMMFETPLEKLDTAVIHLYSKIDTLWYNSPIQITNEGLPPRTYCIKAEWRPNTEYSLETDSAAFCDIYGHVADKTKNGIKVISEETCGSLFVNLHGIEDNDAQIIVNLLDKSGVEKSHSIAQDNMAEFYYIEPGEYYISVLIDKNHNGKWDTGDYDLDLQPEEVYYKNEKIECKAKWDLTTEFDVRKVPLFKQKPRSMVKAKSEQKKKIQDRNLKRANDMNIPYDREKVNSKF